MAVDGAVDLGLDREVDVPVDSGVDGEAVRENAAAAGMGSKAARTLRPSAIRML